MACVGGSPHLIVLGAKLLIVLVIPEGLTAMVAIIMRAWRRQCLGLMAYMPSKCTNYTGKVPAYHGD